MPTLNFKGKTTIWNHHLAVPYHTLDPVDNLDYGREAAAAAGRENLIVEGDNLLALKALLPKYSGRVKCVYIDPPYNTGQENWVYNDNVNHPLFKEWLHKTVDKEDLTRHDKWLCMMTPRLKLLRELLSDDGAIFISIDDNEQHNLRQLMDEIFGEENFKSTFIWHHRKSSQNDIDVSLSHNYIICYAKYVEKYTFNFLKINDSIFSNPDNDPKGDWVADPMDAPGIRENLNYDIENPNTHDIYVPPVGRHWRFSKEKYEEALKTNRIVFGKTGKTKPQYKRYKFEAEEKGINISTIWDDVDTATNATQELLQLFDGNKIFDTPKPVDLIKRILQIATDKDSIILDSFAGSGTTMHAVMDLNKEDGGSRSCILVQMTESSDAEPEKNICRDITRERVKRAIDKYRYDDGFRYVRVGQAIDAETMLAGRLPTWKQLACYVYYLCTGEYPSGKTTLDEKSYCAGPYRDSVIYLVYKKDYDALTKMALNSAIADAIIAAHPKKKKIVYAPACYLDREYMEDNRIEFVGLPYNLFRRTGD